MFDCHAHINSPSFPAAEIPNLIQRAQEKHVKGIVSVAETYEDCLDVLNVAKQYPCCIYPGIGLHPVQPLLKENGDREERGGRTSRWDEVIPVLDLIKEHKDEIACIGEVGLDYSLHVLHSPDDKDTQMKIFEAQIDLANAYDLPLNVHSRSAGHYAIDKLLEKGARRVLMHAFDGKPGYALKALQLFQKSGRGSDDGSRGFYFSVPPSIKRSPQKQKLVKLLPLDHLLLETDSPALSAVKNQVNEPANVTVACEEIARIKGVSCEEVARITSENALKLFPKLKLC